MPEEDFHLSSHARSQAHIGRDIVIAPEIEFPGGSAPRANASIRRKINLCCWDNDFLSRVVASI